ncbi:MAG: preprotein translocase subunit SecG [Candidatus Omnitrophica bacterium CG23_combo_of_CG06-09_8_20_14_all_40_11]|nr:MAG: preprotein translocase subunit SecG [Candidatus Omnitrophica bacterium CG23_combo_of_CG06-09_8_20_14_all_40_11]
MMGLIITIHVIVCVLLIVLILIQRGRGGGLVESFSDVESMFGTKTNAFLTRTTTVLSVLFFVTCLSLAVLSIKQSRSLMRNAKPETLPAGGAMPLQPSAELPKQVPQQLPKPEEKPAPAPTQEAPKAESRTF